MSIFKKCYTDRHGETQRTKTYYVEIRDHLGRRQVISGFRDKASTAALERRLNKLAALRASGESPDEPTRRWVESIKPKLRDRLAKIGLITARQVAALRPLTELVEEWKEHLRAKRRSPSHVKLVSARALRVLAGAKATFWTELDAQRVERFLLHLREQDGGISGRTSNFHLQATRQFCRWVVRNGLATEDPLRVLEPLQAESDRRRVRRALTVSELVKLLAATAAGPKLDGMEGPERALLYRLAAETGLRRGELITLCVRDCDVDDPEEAEVRVRSTNAKNRRGSKLPLRPETAQLIATHIALRLPSARVFSMPSWWKSAECLRADLEAAAIPYEDEDGRVVDFHALRTTFGTNLARAGVALQVAQQLMRHSTPVLTANTYTVLGRADDRRAIRAMPNLSPTAVAARVEATGTAGSAAPNGADLRQNLQSDSGRKARGSRTEDEGREQDAAGDERPETPTLQELTAWWREHIRIELTNRGSPGSPVLKTGGPTRNPSAPLVALGSDASGAGPGAARPGGLAASNSSASRPGRGEHRPPPPRGQGRVRRHEGCRPGRDS